jgi:fatty acid desaturase
VRNGLRLLLAALFLIILASFYHGAIADLFVMTSEDEARFYRLGLFWASVIGGYGVVLAAFGLARPDDPRDVRIRLLPLFLMVMGVMTIYFYLLAAAFQEPPPEHRRLRPGESITI